jgi:hypothetical protein
MKEIINDQSKTKQIFLYKKNYKITNESKTTLNGKEYLVQALEPIQPIAPVIPIQPTKKDKD